MKRENLLGVVAILFSLCALIFGDNIYAQITGRSIFASLQSVTQISPSLTPNVIYVQVTLTSDKNAEYVLLPTNSPMPEIVSTMLPSISGTWIGPVDQPGSHRYTTELVLVECRPNIECGSVNYPELSCGGKITLLAIENGKYRLRENITFGNCINQVMIELQQSSGNSWEAKYSWTGGSATAVLEKSE